MSATLRAHDQLIQVLRLRIARLKKQVFGRSPEKIEREIEQLELALEDLLIAAVESSATPIAEADEAAQVQPAGQAHPKASRVVAHACRQTRSGSAGNSILVPAAPIAVGNCALWARMSVKCSTASHCPPLVRGADVGSPSVREPMAAASAAQMKVVEIARLKKSRVRRGNRPPEDRLIRLTRGRMAQVPAPSRPIEGSMAGAGLPAHVLVSKFDDHLPLYRQNEIFARMGAVRREIDPPDRFLLLLTPARTLVDWCGRACRVLQPLTERIATRVRPARHRSEGEAERAAISSMPMVSHFAPLVRAAGVGSPLVREPMPAANPIRVLDRSLRENGLGKGVKKGRIWAYVRDQR